VSVTPTTGGTVLKTIAFKSGWISSAVQSATFTSLTDPSPTPTATPYCPPWRCGPPPDPCYPVATPECVEGCPPGMDCAPLGGLSSANMSGAESSNDEMSRRSMLRAIRRSRSISMPGARSSRT
jgi:hypothetical protein